VLMGQAPAGTLIVDVTNVRNTQGRVHVDICREANFLKDDCPYEGFAPARPGKVVVIVTHLPPGRYAAQVHHDENLNNRVDRGIFGIPKEGIGFSNDAPIRLSPPRWPDAVFDYKGGAQVIHVKMRYFLGASGPK
jgi:uncharacterized protein (DUF2141 family)